MPKMKTSRSAAKRFKVSGSGKLMREKAFRKHLLEKKSSVRTRRIAGDVEVSSANERNIKRLLCR